MGSDLNIQLIWGVKKEHLPEGLDPESAGLEWFQSGDPDSGDFDDFYGKEICDGLTGLDVLTDSFTDFEEWEEIRKEVDGILEMAGIQENAKMYILMSVNY
ncbi:MAG: hypothetical protein JRL30_29675 [Deltaproteobacteria bacterium]|nr:hypothetical protein [Deltaproteobacteria bacterium]